MLTTITIENFRCFRSLSVPLKPLTVLIGPNDTGKSAFLQALRVVGDHGLYAWPGDARRSDGGAAVEITCATANAAVRFRAKGGESTRVIESLPGCKVPREVPRPLQAVALFKVSATGVPMESEGVASQGDAPGLGETGQRVPALLDHLLRRSRATWDRYVRQAKDRIPGLEDVLVATPQLATRRVDLRIDGGYEFPAERASSGVRTILFYLALANHPAKPTLLLIEEPETGVHPGRLQDIVTLLRDMTRGADGTPPVQVVLTTHSPYLLDYINVDEDQVLVFRREDDGSRTAEPIDAERLKANFLDEFKLGEIWYNSGEEALVKKQK